MPIDIYLAKTGLLFSSPTLLVVTFLIGLFFLDAKAYSQAMMLMLFTLIYNLFLKSIWQIPLNPPLEGWAFPSGHMHTAWVFWGWLAIHYRKWYLFIVYAVMMGLQGFGLMFHNYHNLTDLLGAAGFGTLTLILFYGLNQIPVFKKNLFVVNVILGAIALLFLSLIPLPQQTKPFIWQAHGALMGMAMGWLFLMQFKEAPLKIHQKLVMIAFTVTGMIFMHMFISHPPPRVTPQNFFFVKAFIMMLWVMASKRLLNPICLRIGGTSSQA